MTRAGYRQGLADGLLLAALATLLLLAGGMVRARLGYAWDLEWMEGGMLQQAARVRDLQPLYPPPSLEYVPFLYGPLYSWLLGALGWIFPLGHPLGRALSVLSSGAAMGALIALMRRAGARWPLALATAGLFLSTWDDSGGFLDLVRADALLVALLGWAVWAARTERPVAAGALLAAATLTKQNALLCAAPLGLWFLLGAAAPSTGRRSTLRFLAALTLPLLLTVALLQWTSEGRFLRYLVQVPLGHSLVPERLWPLPAQEWGAALGWALPLALLGLFPSPARRPRWLWGPLTLCLLLSAWLMRAHAGGYRNVHLPAFWCLSLLAGLGLQRLEQRDTRLGLAGCALLALQLHSGAWQAERYRPTELDEQAHQTIEQTLARGRGRVCAPTAGWLLLRNGRRPTVHPQAVRDIDYPGSPFRAAWRQALADELPGCDLMVLGRGSRWRRAVEPLFRRGTDLDLPDAGYPRSGYRVRPEQLWFRRPDPRATP